MIPRLGQRVIYSSKIGDGVFSPADILRTQKTTVTSVAERWADLEPGQTMEVSNSGGTTTHTTGERPESFIVDLSSETHVDLLVHGLGKDYREYNIPLDLDGGAGTWQPQESFTGDYER